MNNSQRQYICDIIHSRVKTDFVSASVHHLPEVDAACAKWASDTLHQIESWQKEFTEQTRTKGTGQ